MKREEARTQKIDRRRLVKSAAITAGVAGATAVAGKGALASGAAPTVISGQSCSQDKQSIRALMWQNSPTIDGHFKDRVKAFNDAHKDTVEVDLQFLPYDQYWQKLQLAYSSGKPYDVYFWDVQAYGHYTRGLLLNLQPMMDKAGLFDATEYPVKLFEPWKLDGKNYYAVPENFQTMALYYNKTLFDAEKLAVPDDKWTWAQIVEAAQKLTKRDGDRVNQWGMVTGALTVWWGMQTLSWAQGSAFFDKILEPTKFMFTDPANVTTLSFVQGLVNQEKVAPSGAVSQQSPETTGFASGRVALAADGSWAMSGYADLPFEWGMTAIPTWEGKRVAPYFMGGWVIAKDSKVPEGAFEWVRWSATDYQDQMAKEHDWIPILNSARESAVAFEGLPAGYKEAVASLANAKLGDLYCKNNQQIWVEVFDPNITDLVNNNTDPKEVAKKMNDAANALL